MTQNYHLQAKIARTFEELENHAAAWDDLAMNAVRIHPMLTYAWQLSFFEHRIADDESWLCLFAYDGEKLVGVLPLVTKKTAFPGLNRTYVRTPFDWHTLAVDFLLREGYEQDGIAILLDYLDHAVPSWGCLEMKRVPADSPTIAAENALKEKFNIIREYDGEGAYLDIEGNFESYFSNLDSRFRHNLRNAARKVENITGVELETKDGTKSTKEDFETFVEMESAGWKGKAGSAIASNESLKNFYEAVVERLCMHDWLEWHFLKTENEIIAGQMTFRMGPTLVGMKTAYNEKFHFCSPGNYMLMKGIEKAHEIVEIKYFDFLNDNPYFKKWKVSTRAHYNLYIYRKDILSLFSGFLPKKTINGLKQSAFAKFLKKK